MMSVLTLACMAGLWVAAQRSRPVFSILLVAACAALPFAFAADLGALP